MKLVADWEVEDGFVGKSRPQSTALNLDDFDAGMTMDEILERVNDAVQEDFTNTITYFVSNADELAEEIFQELAKND